MRRTFVSLLVVLALGVAAPALADSLYGDCHWSDGSKCDGAQSISTSWNGKRAVPRDGRYSLQFEGEVGQRITVYCNGRTVGTVVVNGDTRFDVVCR